MMIRNQFRALASRFSLLQTSVSHRFLSDSIHFDPTKNTTFAELGITSKPLCNALASLRFRTPTLVQQQAIPKILEGPDLVIAAETGCGKTLAYLLPLMELLLSGKTVSSQKYPPVIVLCPTRELCTQILNVITQLCEAMGTTFLLPRMVVGTEEFPAPFQKITDILITTPTAFEENESNDLYTSCYHLVLDEADFLLSDTNSQTTRNMLTKFLRAYDKKNKPDHSIQFIFVGATIPAKGTRSVDSYLRHFFPKLEWLSTSLFHRHKPNLKQIWIEAPCEPWELAKLGTWRLALDANNKNNSSNNENNEQVKAKLEQPTLSYSIEGVTKPPIVGELITPVAEKRLAMLYDALGEDTSRRTVIFCSTLLACQQVAKYLTDKKRSFVVLHGKSPPIPRQEALSKFAKGEASIFICTNAATRGLDLDVDHVIQYDFAENVVDHLHRIGRTGRVSRSNDGSKEASVTNFFTVINRALVNTIRAHGDEPLVGAFSRKASFRKKLKEAATVGEKQEVQVIEDAVEHVGGQEREQEEEDLSKKRRSQTKASRSDVGEHEFAEKSDSVREQRAASRRARRALLAQQRSTSPS